MPIINNVDEALAYASAFLSPEVDWEETAPLKNCQRVHFNNEDRDALRVLSEEVTRLRASQGEGTVSKTYGQIAYEAGSAWIMTEGEERPADGFARWEEIDDQDRAYWDEIGRVLSKTVFAQHFSGLPWVGATLTEFARKYRSRNLDTSRPGEVLLSYLDNDCEHYSENEAGDGPGDRCELCGTPMPVTTVRSALPPAEDDDSECGICGEFGGHRTSCPGRD